MRVLSLPRSLLVRLRCAPHSAADTSSPRFPSLPTLTPAFLALSPLPPLTCLQRRFGKFIELQFDLRGRLVGSQISTYLLEKVRIVNQADRERNYHAFYQLCAGASDAERREWGLDAVSAYRYTNQSGLYTLTSVSDADEFALTNRALRVMGFADAERIGIWQTLTALLHLGNVAFVGDDVAAVSPASDTALTQAASLLGVRAADLAVVLTQRRIEVRGDVTMKRLTVAQAGDGRDALAKQVYGKMFEWIVSRINDCIRHPDRAWR